MSDPERLYTPTRAKPARGDFSPYQQAVLSSDLCAGAKVIALVVQRHFDANVGWAYAGIEHLSEQAGGIKRSQLLCHLKTLREGRWIDAEARGRLLYARMRPSMFNVVEVEIRNTGCQRDEDLADDSRSGIPDVRSGQPDVRSGIPDPAPLTRNGYLKGERESDAHARAHTQASAPAREREALPLIDPAEAARAAAGARELIAKSIPDPARLEVLTAELVKLQMARKDRWPWPSYKVDEVARWGARRSESIEVVVAALPVMFEMPAVVDVSIPAQAIASAAAREVTIGEGAWVPWEWEPSDGPPDLDRWVTIEVENAIGHGQAEMVQRINDRDVEDYDFDADPETMAKAAPIIRTLASWARSKRELIPAFEAVVTGIAALIEPFGWKAAERHKGWAPFEQLIAFNDARAMMGERPILTTVAAVAKPVVLQLTPADAQALIDVASDEDGDDGLTPDQRAQWVAKLTSIAAPVAVVPVVPPAPAPVVLRPLASAARTARPAAIDEEAARSLSVAIEDRIEKRCRLPWADTNRMPSLALARWCLEQPDGDAALTGCLDAATGARTWSAAWAAITAHRDLKPDNHRIAAGL